MPDQQAYLIIGNGIAGVTAAEILRTEDSTAEITVIADDPFPVYYRPALKDYLAGRVREDKLWARPNSFYQQENIRFIADRVVGIQAGQHSIQLRSGRSLGYSRLLLANGARASRLTCPGLDLQGVTTLRTVADYQTVLKHLGAARRIVVSGSGTLALETIETLRHRGYHVTHLLRRRTLWSDVLDETASDLVVQQEQRDGVDVRIEEEITEIMGKQGKVSGVVTTRGTRIPCEMVIIAIGVEPIIDFVKSSGIPCGRGVKVDGAMRTSAPDIYAAGDVLETTDGMTGRTRVIGQWYPAVQQARAAAYSMLDLLDTSHPFRPGTFYNATFLYGLDFASVGLTTIPRGGQGYQELIADPQPRVYRKVLLKDGVPVGMLSLGDRKGALAFKRAIDYRVSLLPVASKLFASSFNLHEWLDQQGVPPPILGANREGNVAVKQVAYTGTNYATVLPSPGREITSPPERVSAPTALKPQPSMQARLVPLVNPTSPLGQTGDLPSGDSPSGNLPPLVETSLSQTRVMTVGRQAGVYLLIDHQSVSRRHAEIVFANGQYLLRDLVSTNGTFVNDARLEAGSVHVLQPNDQIRFGKIIKFAFQHVVTPLVGVRPPSESQAAPAGLTRLQAMKTGFYDPKIAGQPIPPQGQPLLNADGSLLLPGAASALPAATVAALQNAPALITITQDVPQAFFLKKGKRVILGRDKQADIILADMVASRKHAVVFQGPHGYYIRDLGSSNGVTVNQTKIDNPYLLTHGDRIGIGSLTIYFMSPGGDQQGTRAPTRGLPSHPHPPMPLRNDLTCPNCGAANLPIARFCIGCGTSL